VEERYSEYLSTKYFVVSSSKLEETSKTGFDGWIVDRKKNKAVKKPQQALQKCSGLLFQV